MLWSFRKNSTLLIDVFTPLAKALAMKLTCESVCRPGPGIGEVAMVTVGGVPTALAITTFTAPEVADWELVSVTRAVRTWFPISAVVGIHVAE